MLSSVPWVADSGFPTAAQWFSRIASSLTEVMRDAYLVWSSEDRLQVTGVVLWAFMIVGAIADVASAPCAA